MYKNYTSNNLGRNCQFEKTGKIGWLFRLLLLSGIFFNGFNVVGQTTQSFTYTGSNQNFVVPAGVTSISVKMWGAGGAGSIGGPSSGGSGAFVKGTMAVTPGQTLVMVVGGTGSYSTTTGGFGGGGNSGHVSTGASGGGYSGIFNNTVSQANALAVAGGGGGGGYYGNSAFGGGGGATTGVTGGGRNANNVGGKGGTVSAGGAGGTTNGTGNTGSAGTALTGGAGGVNASYGGGGGGGGYFGGGGGYGSASSTNWSSAGGGGSSFLGTMTATTNTVGTTDSTGATAQAPGSAETGYVTGSGNGGNGTVAPGGNGLIFITYTLPVGAPTITSYTPNTNLCIGGGQTVTITGTNFIQVTAVKFNGVNAASYTVVNATTITAVTPASLGAGTVSVTNTGGSGTGSAYTVIASPTVTLSPSTATICQPGGLAVTLTAGGALTYTYNGTSGLTPTSGSPVSAMPTSTTTYIVTGTDGNGCKGTASSTITVSEGPAVSATATPSTICTGSNSQLLATVGTTANYTVASTPFAMITANGTVTSTGLTDDDIYTVSLPFNVRFFGTSYSTGYIHSNGFMSFTSGQPTGSPYVETIPTAATPNNYIAISHDDLNVTGTGADIRYFTNGTAPNRIFVIEYNAVKYYNTAANNGNLTGQIQIFEADNHIEVHVSNSVDPTISAKSLGIENAGGTIGVAPATRNNASYDITTPEAWRFSPSGGTATYVWSPATFLSSTSIANPVATAVTSTTAYTVTGTVAGCSNTSTVTVNTSSGPSITTNPGNQSKCSGGTAIFSVVANGASLTYQWRRGTTNLVNGGTISGATTATLTIVGLVPGDAATDYNVVVSSTCGSPVTSTNAALTLNDITVTVSPTTASVCGPQLLTATTAASSPSYVWRRNGAVISGATAASYSATEQGTYSVTVTGGAGSCVAPAATSSVFIKANPGAASVTSNPNPADVCIGNPVTLGASATNTNTTILREDFNGSVPGFITINNSTGGTSPATAAWALYISGTSIASNDNSNFVLSNSDGQGSGGTTATILQTPAMDLSGYNSASLSFYQMFRFNAAPDAGKVEVSTDNSTWTTLATYTSNQGSELAWIQTTFNLTPYTGAGKTTVYVRFKFDAAFGYYWGIDNLLVTGTSTPTITWSPSTDLYSSLSPLTAYAGQASAGVFSKPTQNRNYTATATASNGCFTTNTVSVTTKALPTFSVSDKSLCSDNALGVDVSPTGGDSAYTYVWSPTATLSGGNISVDGTSNNGDIILAKPTATATYNVTANSNTTGCSSAPHPFTVSVSPQAVITASTLSRVKSPGTSTTFVVTATNAAAYQWQVSADGGEYVNIDGSYVPVNGESYSGATTATLTINNIALEMNGYTYRCKVKGAGACNFVTPDNTQEGTLQVLDIGFAANVPADASVCETGTANFSVTTTGGTPDNYAWQMSKNNGAFITIVNGVDAASGFTFSGADTASLTVSNIAYSATNTYKFLCTINDESVSSEIALLNVNKSITGTQAPQTNLGLCSLGSTSTFTAKATGTISGAQWQYATSASGPWTNVSNGTPANITYSPSLTVAGSTDGERTASLAVSSNATTPVVGGPYFYKAIFQRANSVCTDFTTASGQLDLTAPVLTSQPVSASVIVTNSQTFAAAITSDPAATFQWQYSTSPSSGFQDIPTNSQTGASYSGAATATLTVTTSGVTPLLATNYYRARVISNGCTVYSNAAQLTVTNYCAPTYANGPGSTNQITKVTLGTLTNNSGASVTPFYTLYTGITVPDLIRYSTNNVQVTVGSDANQYTGVWIDYNQNGTFEASEGVVSSTNAGANGISTLAVTVPSTALLGQTRMRVRGGDDAAMLTSQACGATNSVAGETEDYLVNIITTPAPTITSLGASTACAGTSVTINGTNLYGAIASGVTVNGTPVSSITSNTGSVLVVVTSAATPAGSGTNLISVTAAGGVTPSSPTFAVVAAPAAVVVSGGGSTCGASITLTAANGGSGTIYYQGITSNGTSTTTASTSQAVTANGTYYFRAQSTTGGCWGPQGSATASFYTTPSAITVTPDTPSVCADAVQSLTASGGTNVLTSSTIGTGTTFLALTNEQTAFCNRRTNYVGQTIYTAAELTAAGVTPGNIISMAYNISNNGSGTTNPNFTVKIGHVGSQTVFTDFVSNAAYTTVYGPATYTHASPGFQVITFTTPFVWNGTDNICVDVRMDGADSTNNARTQATTTAINSSVYGYDSATSGTPSTTRLNIQFGYAAPANAFTWSPAAGLYTDSGATTPYTGTAAATVYVKRSTTGTYTVTSTNPGGCSSTKNVTVTVDVLVGSAITTTGTRCASTNFTATANRTGGGAPFHYSWNDGVGGTYPDAATVTVNKPAGTYNFDCTITDNCGGTTHSTGSIVVRGLPAVSLSTVTPANARICGSGTVSMTATGASTYAWSPTTALAPAAGTSATEVSSATATTIYTVTGTDANGCINTATQTVTVGPAIATPTATATPATICSGNTSVLNATATATPTTYITGSVGFAPIASGTGTVTLASAGTAVTAVTSGNLDDGYWNGLTLPFNFNYNGVSYSTVNVQTNGIISFTALSSTQGYDSSPQMPNTIAPNNIVGIYGDMYWTSGGVISCYTSGTAPNRIYVVNYNGTPTPTNGGGFYNSGIAPTALVNFQIQLFENGNKIQIHTANVTSDATNLHTMGIENSGGTAATVISGRNNALWSLSNDAVEFAPQVLNYAWTGPNSFTSSLQSPTTPVLTATSTYSVTATELTSGCTSSAKTVNVTVQALPNAGTNGTLTICSTAALTTSQLFASLGGTPQAGGTWTPALAGAGTYTYTVNATSPCTGSATAQVVVTVQAAANAGTNGTLTICSTSTLTTSQLFASLGGTPQAGGSWSPALAGAGVYTYTVTATSPCTTNATATVTVTSQAAANAGSNGTLTICAGSTVTTSQLFAQLGGTPQAGGIWSPTLAGAGVYTYTVNATSPCTGNATATVTVTSQAAANAGSNGTLTICAGSTLTASQLFAQLGGSPQAGGTWTPALAGAGTYTYTVNAVSPCTGNATAQVVVTAQAAPNAGSNGALTICSGTTVTASQLFAQLTGTPSAGGTWTPALAGAGTYTYHVAATSPCTVEATAQVVVTAVSCQSTQLSNCGNIPVLTSVNARIYANNTVTTATKYRFRVAISTAPTTYFYAETTYPSFRLTDVVGLTPAYGTTYNVDIQNEFLIGSQTVTSAYGPMCSVTTQAPTNITVPTNQCGQVLAAINSKIYVNGVTGATMYTYRIAKQSAPTVFGYIETPYSNFRLTQALTSGNVAIEHGTVYLVAVSVTTASGSSNFNGECQITTPAGPVTTLQASQCGDDDTPYVVPTKSTKVYAADFVSGATYTFKLEQYDAQSNLVATKFATSPINYFDCNMFTGVNSLLPNTNYHVYVSINYYGQGPYDHDCVVKTPAALKQEEVTTLFSAVAYPNPFANNFMVDVKSSSQSVVNLKVYDMIGRLIEQRDVRMSDLETTTIGDRYPSGVYNVVVSQENSVETVRVVKR